MPDLTPHASRALAPATRAAARHRHNQVLPPHLLVGPLGLPGFSLTYNLAGKGFTQPGVDNAVAALFSPTGVAAGADAVPFSAQVLARLCAPAHVSVDTW